MKQNNYNYFVVAAIVAAELNKAMLLAQDISLTASNARALALRAGQGAAGFSAITEFIDNLAELTVSASKSINKHAVAISLIASDSYRAESAMNRFDTVYKNAADARFLSSLDKCFDRTKYEHNRLHILFEKKSNQLKEQLEELAKELRTANVLAVMSRVEASQAGSQFEQSLNNVAQNVADAATDIQQRVNDAQQLINHMS